MKRTAGNWNAARSMMRDRARKFLRRVHEAQKETKERGPKP